MAKVGWNLWLQWLLAYTLSASVAGAVGRALGGSLGGVVGAGLGAATVGLALGVAQGLVLVPFFKQTNRWIIATAAGSVVGSILGGFLDQALIPQSGDFWANVAGLACVGAAIGLAQGWLLQANYRSAWIWIPGNMLALALGPFVALDLTLILGGLLGPSVAIFVRPLVSGAITGGLMVWVLQQPKTKL